MFDIISNNAIDMFFKFIAAIKHVTEYSNFPGLTAIYTMYLNLDIY